MCQTIRQPVQKPIKPIKIKIGALISGGGSNLQAIIDSCESGYINGKIIFTGSDKIDAYGLERARKQNIPTFAVDYKTIIKKYQTGKKYILPGDFDIDDILLKQNLFSEKYDIEKKKKFIISRVIAEAELIKKIKPYPFDLLILAGFMRNLTPYFIDKINISQDLPRIMNIHPALLPAFPGLDGYGDTFRYGCKIGGCTVHFVDYGEDSGPIIGQRAFKINSDDTLDSIKKKGLHLEWKLYPECIKLFAENRIKITTRENLTKSSKPRTRRITVI